MFARLNVFTKITLLFVVLLVLVLFLYTYSNRESVRVIKHEIQNNTMNHLSTFADSVESNIYQLSLYGMSIGQDSSIQEYQRPDYKDVPYERVKVGSAILEKMNLYNAASKWHSTITLYFPRLQKVISTDYYAYIPYRKDEFSKPLSKSWAYTHEQFEWYTTDPTTAMDTPGRSRLITKISFPVRHLINMLDQNKLNNKGDPFMFHPELGLISNSKANDTLNAVQSKLKEMTLSGKGGFTTTLDHTEYYVSYIQSGSLGWYYVDYVPMQQILGPITNSRNLFYASIAVLIAMSVVVLYVLYRSVQLPLLQLVKGTNRLSTGDFSVRLHYTSRNEFSLLFARFNIMAQRIQELIENVYEEQLRRREATLKQLQSQINPHFLYNCLFYIKNMARMKNEKAVVAMSLNLGEYYRYITRSENDQATIKEELTMVKNYLEIQELRLERMHYTIDIPDDMLHMRIPRLTLQPIVENAIIHGIEPRTEDGHITITGHHTDELSTITVEDSGRGMTENQMQELTNNLHKPLDGSMGCGTWNVHQRLSFLYGERAGLSYEHGSRGGVKVSITWYNNINE
ncbi:sensor histidine kinase [Paenibacillus barcinonensis]|uniref:Sensor histidine kinase n=1 Tax=Paenibacillus barcinonensis TaxID=198119 RepID=A0A2V4V842_PAEBA|nr:histidine kinase [Paenibacillus barcinonensis]PYE48009.1 two-component system sensor histidine kinase YesM [Paenibacillus barcinonensis]QKS55128.1 sensor histidine kinase [Paenibacillus barcinonensis]